MSFQLRRWLSSCRLSLRYSGFDEKFPLIRFIVRWKLIDAVEVVWSGSHFCRVIRLKSAKYFSRWMCTLMSWISAVLIFFLRWNTTRFEWQRTVLPFSNGSSGKIGNMFHTRHDDSQNGGLCRWVLVLTSQKMNVEFVNWVGCSEYRIPNVIAFLLVKCACTKPLSFGWQWRRHTCYRIQMLRTAFRLKSTPTQNFIHIPLWPVLLRSSFWAMRRRRFPQNLSCIRSHFVCLQLATVGVCNSVSKGDEHETLNLIKTLPSLLRLELDYHLSR